MKAITKTVIEAERGAIEVYNNLAKKTLGKDLLTYELVLHILGEEVQHEDDFENLLS
ncbi:MAG: ferritin-like domain-containing protein [Anaerolineae bacterium]